MPAAMQEVLERLERELVCGICLEQLRSAVMLPCAHRFCGECAEQVTRCPLCKAAFVRRAVVADAMADAVTRHAAELRARLKQAENGRGAGREEQAGEPAAKRARTEEEARLDALRAAFNREEAARMAGGEGEEWRGPVVLLYTGLDEESERMAARLVAARRDSRIADKWAGDVTHAVCGTDHQGRARRTLKYLCAVGAGGRVVGTSWLRAWDARGAVPAAQPHLAAGDVTSSEAGGPQRAAQRGGGLMRGLRVALVEPLETNREVLLEVLEAVGAVSDMTDPEVVLCALAPPPSELPFAAAQWLHPSWLLDSAAAHLRLPSHDYGSIPLPEQEEQEEEDDEDSPSLQLSDD